MTGHHRRGIVGPITAFVVNVTWTQLQPSPNGPLTENNPIDQAILAARALGTGVGVKIRLLTGIDAPAWVKALDGGPVSVYSTLDHVGGTIGRFWTTDFGRAYDDLWDKLAARYDAVPEVREITASRCMTVFAETFLRDTSDPTTGQQPPGSRLLSHGGPDVHPAGDRRRRRVEANSYRRGLQPLSGDPSRRSRAS